MVLTQVHRTRRRRSSLTSKFQKAEFPWGLRLIWLGSTHLILDCINCFIAGSVKVTGHISVDHFKLKDLTLDGKPQGLNGAMELEAQITKYEKPDSLKFTKDLFSAPVPDAGIEVPGIFKIGAIVSYEVGVQAQLQGSATIDFGLGLKVPDSAGIHADILHPESSTAQGFSGDITPIFDVKDLSATVQFAAFAQPKLSFGVELTEIGTLDIALAFKMPQIALKFIAAYSMFQSCPPADRFSNIFCRRVRPMFLRPWRFQDRR